jgi:hypothetical protein
MGLGTLIVRRGTSVAYGIDGYDAPEHQSLAAVHGCPSVARTSSASPHR